MLGSEGMVLRNRWTLTSFLARGGCAEVWAVSCDAATAKFEGRDAACGWVAKLCAEPAFRSAAEKKKKRKATPEELVASTLSWEHSLYHGILRGHPAVPQVMCLSLPEHLPQAIHTGLHNSPLGRLLSCGRCQCAMGTASPTGCGSWSWSGSGQR